MVFAWLQERRRHELLAQPFPSAWADYLRANLPFYASLTAEEQARLHDDLRILMAEKSWEGCAGLTLTDEMKVMIAAQASLLILNLPHEYYPNVESILVYPTGYYAPEKTRDPSGVVHEGQGGRLGEAWDYSGPVVLSWADAYTGGRNPEDGHNVVLHEFAHKLDMRDGEADGVPQLDTDQEYEDWTQVMHAEYEELVKQSEEGHATLLDHYGATNAGEFFAVATEAFFEKAVRMQREHPRLYAVLSRFYRQDPAARLLAHQEAEDANPP